MKEKANPKPTLLYIEEHLICSEYLANKSSGFVNEVLLRGAEYCVTKSDRNRMIFLLKGKAEIRYKQDEKFSIEQGNFFCLPMMTDMTLLASTDVHFLVHIFNEPVHLCDKVAIQSLESYRDGSNKKVKLLDIRPPMDNFLSLLTTYLNVGMLCRHMHEIKQKELFLLLRAFYTKEENAALLAQIIDQNIDFRTIVMKNITTSRNVVELAQACNCSLTSFNRLFKKHFNTSPYQWVQQQKLNKIIEKLSDEKISFAEIVDEFEFSSPAHFTVFCKKYLKATPSVFRKDIILHGKDRLKHVFKNPETDQK